MTLPSTDSDRMAQAGIGSTPHHPHRVETGSTSDRTHPLGAGFRPAITRGVGAGFKPASTTTPRTAEDRLHLCEYATILTTPGAGDGVRISSQVKRFQAQEVLLGKLRPYPAKVACPKRNGVCVGETGRNHPVGAGFRPTISHGVGAGLKPAPTTTPRTAEDRIHLCEYATILTTRDAGDGVSISSQLKRFQAQEVLFGKLRPYPAKVACPKRNGVSLGETGRNHPVGAGFRPTISHGVGAGLKPAPTTTPRTAEDRIHLCEYATILTTRDAGDGVSISSQLKRFQAQEVLFGKLRPYPAKVTCPKRNGVCVGEAGRTHPVGAGFRPDIAHPVEAGLKPASTATPHTAEDRLHLCENATILTPRGAGK